MIHYARKQRQLKNLAHRIADEVAANGGALTRLAAEWLRQLKRGYAALRGMLSGAAMRHSPHATINVLWASQLEAAEGKRKSAQLYSANVRRLLAARGSG